MIYVYALTDPGAAPRGPLGFDGAALECASAAGASGIYCVVAESQPPVTAEKLWHHETVVERVMDQQRATLPTRFGTVLPDAERLRDMLAEHAETIHAALDQVRGLVEVGVRIRLLEDAEPEPGRAVGVAAAPAGGRAYLMQRLEREQHRQQREARMVSVARDALAPLSELAHSASPPDPAGRASAIVSTAYLIPPDDVPAFTAEVAAIDAAHDALELVATGPWPAYSFAPALLDGDSHG